MIHRCKVLEFFSDNFWFVREHPAFDTPLRKILEIILCTLPERTTRPSLLLSQGFVDGLDSGEGAKL